MLSDFSDPELVQRRADWHGITVYPSTRKNKKYMVFANNRHVHFGAMGYQDFTKHNDEARRHRFQARNIHWADAAPLSASWLSYYLLW